MIEITNLTKKFRNKKGEVVANENISLSIPKGKVYGILGQNGSGKTTLINQIIGLYKIEDGEIFISGNSVKEDPKAARTLCSVQTQGQLAFGELTPKKAVRLMGELRGGKPEEIDEQIDYLFSALDILEWANTPGKLLSGGIKRLTAFCMAVICAKDFIILDEPTNDVDPVRRKRLWQEIKRMTAKGCGVIVVTHNILELESVADIVTIIDDGKLISTGTITDIKSRLSNHLKLNLHYDDEGTAEKLRIPEWGISSSHGDGMMIITLAPEKIDSALEWGRTLVTEKSIVSYSISDTTLEDVYIDLIKKGA